MSKFQVDDLVIWQDEQSQDITGIITKVKEDGFTVLWDLSPRFNCNDGVANEMFYRWEYLNLRAPSGKPVIRLDTCRIRDKKICQLVD